MSILFTMITLMLLMAIVLFIYAVVTASDGVEISAGFVHESGPTGLRVSEKKNRLNTERGGMVSISAVTSAGS